MKFRNVNELAAALSSGPRKLAFLPQFLCQSTHQEEGRLRSSASLRKVGQLEPVFRGLMHGYQA